MRLALGFIVTVTAASCAPHTVDLGGNADASGGVSGTFAPTTMLIANCPDTASTSAVEGNGWNGERPAACDAPRGPAATASSPTDVASLVAGLWYDCTGQAFGIQVSQEGSRAIRLTSDGQYLAYGEDDDLTLQSLTPGAGLGSSSSSGGTAATPSATGTFTVVDGAATYGPGTYELQLHPSDGGLFKGQVLVTTGPTQLHFFPTNQAEQIFTPPLPWSVRKGVCSCVSTTETASFEEDAAGLANAIVGRWMSCSALPAFGNIGLEFAAGNAWYQLNEDASGNITRASGDNDHGTFQIVPTHSLPPGEVGSEPLTIQLNHGSQYTPTQALYFGNPRLLLVGVGRSTNNQGGTATDYAICMPMP
jgi:hypothetical protein